MKNHFLSENREPKGYTISLSLSEIHVYIHISIYKTIQDTVQKCIIIQYSNLTQGATVNGKLRLIKP